MKILAKNTKSNGSYIETDDKLKNIDMYITFLSYVYRGVIYSLFGIEVHLVDYKYISDIDKIVLIFEDEDGYRSTYNLIYEGTVMLDKDNEDTLEAARSLLENIYRDKNMKYLTKYASEGARNKYINLHNASDSYIEKLNRIGRNLDE